MAVKIKKNDKILVISGKDRGKVGKVLKAMPKDNKILVEGVNWIMRHQKPRKSNEKGAIIKKENPINASDAKLICPQCQKATRVGFTVSGDQKFRACKKCKAEFK